MEKKEKLTREAVEIEAEKENNENNDINLSEEDKNYFLTLFKKKEEAIVLVGKLQLEISRIAKTYEEIETEITTFQNQIFNKYDLDMENGKYELNLESGKIIRKK